MSRELTDQELQELCREFLELTSSGADDAVIRPVLEKLLPTFIKWIETYLKGRDVKPRDLVFDIRQEVLEKALRKPPNHAPDVNPMATLRKWFIVASNSTLYDTYRKRQYTSRTGEKTTKHVASHDISEMDWIRAERDDRVDERIEAKQISDALISWLEEEGKKINARYMRALREHPELRGNELAQVLEISEDNLYQIAYRTRKLAVSFRKAHAS